MPSDSAASRICAGTSRSISSVVRTTTGNTMNPSEMAPASAENPPIGDTTSVYRNRPSTIDGADSRMSLMKRITSPSRRPRAYSARYVPAAMPIGVAIATASAHISSEPANALSRPPDTSPGGGVICVNRCGPNAARPRLTVVHRIQTSQNRPSAVAAAAISIVAPLTIRRRRYRGSATPFIACPRASRGRAASIARSTAR